MLDDFIARCRAATTTETALTDIRAALGELVADRAALADQLELHGADVDQVFHEDDRLTIMLCETSPGTDQPPHDHQLHTMIGIVDGAEVHRFFHRTDTDLAPTKGRTIGPGEVLSMTPDAVHAIAALGPEQCRAIHVYLGSISTVERSLFHPETFTEEPLSIERYTEFIRPTSTSA